MITPTKKKTFTQQQTRPPVKPPVRPPVVDDDEGEDEGENKELSLADRINAIAKTISNNATDVAPGVYEAIVSEAVLQEPDAKGQSVRLVFALCSSDFKDQNRIAQWYRIVDSDQEPQSGAIKSLAFNLAKLGYQFDFDDLEDQLAEITKDKPGIIAKVTNNESQGRVFTNVSVDKLAENNEVILEYKDNLPY